MWCVQDLAFIEYPPSRPIADILEETLPGLWERESQLIRRFDDAVLTEWLKSRRTQDYTYLWQRLDEISKTRGHTAMLDAVNLQYIVWLERNPHVPIGEIQPKTSIRKSRTTPALSVAAKATSSATATASASSTKAKKRQRTKSVGSTTSRKTGARARSGKAPRAEPEQLSDDDSQSSQSTRHERDSDFNP